jgi:hypothetical protein
MIIGKKIDDEYILMEGTGLFGEDEEICKDWNIRELLIDDIRSLGVDVIARTYDDGIKALKEMGPWDVLFLDHDLGCFDENGREMTGRDIMKFLISNPQLAPKKIICVSGNPYGREYIESQIVELENILNVKKL